jgi:hypothetical protein
LAFQRVILSPPEVANTVPGEDALPGMMEHVSATQPLLVAAGALAAASQATPDFPPAQTIAPESWQIATSVAP